MNKVFSNNFNKKEKEKFIKDVNLIYETDYLEFIKIKYLLKGIAKEKRKQLSKNENCIKNLV
ncbi:hypothetical protein K9770_18850 [Clostridioides difficile]|uniref:hypothetical protein n=1 Tax=Clostridioides difficile TaxID=1496 RepID=UPI00038D718D|nr:hypothetical protein [Clostridioides difficile]EGT4908140.1 hypothetical protein [Clostridioides difficile]EGT5014209.1 hypothetical protein [Clostridioides difficile]EJA6351286.1 hypothetical protein [Clostridioides difficile]EQI06882.1 hypothetical protein QOG_0904 [Clostridioides difficile Y10]MBY1101115.1 hypothetical protein [Clostridioides difficile]